MSFILQVPVKDKPRGVVIADHGDPGKYEYNNNVTSALEFSMYVEGGAAVAFWLPANAYATITVFKHENDKHSPQFFFNYEVFHCNARYVEDELEKLALPAANKLSFLERMQSLQIECPVGSGIFQPTNCRPGYFPVCQGDRVVCVRRTDDPASPTGG